MNALSMNKAQYEQAYKEHEAIRKQVAQDPWRLTYHIMPESGWLNDPNGLCQFQGIYHVYYQYSPFDTEGKVKLWGHITTLDFRTWTQAEPVLFPDSREDMRGVYSGSAYIDHHQLHFFYTGNVKRFDRDDYDYTLAGREQNTMHVVSKDGFHFEEKQCVMKNSDYPQDISCHVRDPKLYKKDGHTFMVLGARDRHDKGCVLVYESENLTSWVYRNRIQTVTPFGYMWECPDVFDLDGRTVMILCPQGLSQQGHHFQSVYSCGCFFIEGDIASTYSLSPFQELDYGFDFYAPQTFLDEQGRRILIGWMGMPDIPYHNPTVKNNWQHALTMPRILHVKDHHLYQTPLPEMKQLRYDEQRCSRATFNLLEFTSQCFELLLDISELAPFKLWLRNDTALVYEDHCLSLHMGEEGYGRIERSLDLEHLSQIQIFSDTSSLEIFINEGAYVFTTRVYETKALRPLVFEDCKLQANIVCYRLDGYVYQ